MTNIPDDIKGKAEKLIFKFEFSDFEFNKIDIGQPFTLNYEKKKYRQDQLAALLFSLLPYFALTESEFKDFQEEEKSPDYFLKTAIRKIIKPGVKAGDYGEILLFLILEVFYGSKKLVTKVHYRTGIDFPVYGADAVHFSLEQDGEIAFWFGEAKFYKDFNDALREAFNSVSRFLDAGLKKQVEWLIPSRIEINKEVNDELWRKVTNLIDSEPSLDSMTLNIPILITYEEKSLEEFDDIESKAFKDFMRKKFEEKFASVEALEWRKIFKRVNLIVFLLPIEDVARLKVLINKKDEGARI